jgi:hypothetical protein
VRKRYYEISAEIRPGWTLPRTARVVGIDVDGELGSAVPDPNAWDATPPHVIFANLGYAKKQPVSRATTTYRLDGLASAAEASDFIKRYGVVGDASEERHLEPGDGFRVSILLFSSLQENFRHRWKSGFPRGAGYADDYVLELTRGASRLFELRPADLITCMRFLLARDLEQKLARFCENPSCAAPYFVAERSDQKYCTRKCANLVMQHRWRKKQRRKKP